MADPTVLTNPNKSIIPSVIAQLIQAGQGGDAQAVTGAAEAGQNVSLPPPTVAQAAQASAPPPPDIPPNIQGAIGATQAPTPSADPFTDMVKPPQDAQPKLAPVHKSLGQKFMSALPYVGAAGAAMEAAGDPHGSGSGGKMLEQSLQARNAGAAKRRELEQVEIPKARATVDYLSGKNETAQKVADTKAGSATDVQAMKGNSAQNVANINATSRAQIEALKAGAGVMIDPEMAQIAHQPQFAGKVLSGKTLADFMKMYTATGASIHDLGEEGMWSVDKAGNRIKRVTVSSPSVARANAFAKAKAENTPTNVLRVDENGNPYMAAISQAEQLKSNEPTASTENSVLGPTGDMRNKAAIAERAKQTGTRVLEDLKDPNIRAKLGPLVGRFGTLENVIGNMPPELAETAQDLKSFAQFVGGQHPVRGLNALEAFEKSIGGIGQNADTLEAKIASQLKTSDFVSNQGTIKPNRPGAARKPAAQGGAVNAQPTHIVKDARGNRIGTVVNGQYVPDGK